MTVLNTASAVRLGALNAKAVYAGAAKVWPRALLDSFTDVANVPVEDHVADSGHLWTEHPTATGGTAVITAEGKYRCTQSIALHVSSFVPVSAEYDVVMDHNFKSLISTNTGSGQFGRLDPTVVSGYHVRFTGLSGVGGTRWELYKFLPGSATALGTFAQTLTPGATYNVRLVIRDAYKAVEINGVERIRSTDNAVTAAGRIGIRSSGAVATNTGVHLDNLAVAA